MNFVNLPGAGPLYFKVYDAVRRAIADGRYASGDKLPGSRVAAREFGVSRNVVVLAYDQLIAEGYVTAKSGSGTYVSDGVCSTQHSQHVQPKCSRSGLSARRLSPYGRRIQSLDVRQPHAVVSAPPIDFQYGSAAPDALTIRQWARLLRKHFCSERFSYGDSAGYWPLREAVSRHLGLHRDLHALPENVIVVSGSQQALDLISRITLDPNASVVLEEPHYQGARHCMQAIGATVVPCPVDAEGLNLQRMPRSVSNVRLAYVTPSHQFPTGAIMPLARRMQLLEWAERCDAYIIEDDYDSEFRYTGRPVQTLRSLDRSDRVIYVGTFAKSLSPSTRLGFILSPPHLVTALLNAKWVADRGCPTLEQSVLAEFMNEGLYARHLRRMSRRYDRNREALVSALAKHLGQSAVIEGSSAGAHLVAWFPELGAHVESEFVAAASKLGVGVYPIAPYYLHTRPRICGILFGYATTHLDQIESGVERLSLALASMRRGKPIN